VGVSVFVFPVVGLRCRDGVLVLCHGVSLVEGLEGEPVGHPRKEVQQQDPDGRETMEVETTAAVAVED
jgi:hypothetical protein